CGVKTAACAAVTIGFVLCASDANAPATHLRPSCKMGQLPWRVRSKFWPTGPTPKRARGLERRRGAPQCVPARAGGAHTARSASGGNACEGPRGGNAGRGAHEGRTRGDRTQLELGRIRATRVAAIPTDLDQMLNPRTLARLCAFERYERLTLNRHKAATRWLEEISDAAIGWVPRDIGN